MRYLSALSTMGLYDAAARQPALWPRLLRLACARAREGELSFKDVRVMTSALNRYVVSRFSDGFYFTFFFDLRISMTCEHDELGVQVSGVYLGPPGGCCE